MTTALEPGTWYLLPSGNTIELVELDGDAWIAAYGRSASNSGLTHFTEQFLRRWATPIEAPPPPPPPTRPRKKRRP